MASVRWRHRGDRLVLPIAVLAPMNAANPHLVIRVTGLLDTGATGTGVREDVANALGLRPKGQRRILTANGVIFCPEVMFRIGFVAGDYNEPGFDAEIHAPYVLEKHVAGYQMMGNFSYGALIGMDVLGQMDLEILRGGTASLVLP